MPTFYRPPGRLFQPYGPVPPALAPTTPEAALGISIPGADAATDWAASKIPPNKPWSGPATWAVRTAGDILDDPYLIVEPEVDAIDVGLSAARTAWDQWGHPAMQKVRQAAQKLSQPSQFSPLLPTADHVKEAQSVRDELMSTQGMSMGDATRHVANALAFMAQPPPPIQNTLQPAPSSTPGNGQ